jgi:hypothetical protein
MLAFVQHGQRWKYALMMVTNVSCVVGIVGVNKFVQVHYGFGILRKDFSLWHLCVQSQLTCTVCRLRCAHVGTTFCVHSPGYASLMRLRCFPVPACRAKSSAHQGIARLWISGFHEHKPCQQLCRCLPAFQVCLHPLHRPLSGV